jgi:hypothetical protein
MKSIFLVLIFIITLLAQPPSQNGALNSISPSSHTKEHDNSLQKSLDSWLKDDWEPAQKKVKSEKKVLHVKEKEDNSTFKLQTYVDKWSQYNKEKASEPKKPSHVEMINSLPAIGK